MIELRQTQKFCERERMRDGGWSVSDRQTEREGGGGVWAVAGENNFFKKIK
jgi:hypothetical protein